MLQIVVNLRVGTEAGRVVHLEEPRLQFMIEHDVEAEQIVA